MAHVAANGLRVHYTVEGDGPPLILLHGATSSALEDWAAQRPLFRRTHTLYLVDARGHAGTRWDPADGWGRDLLVADLGAFADALGLADFHLGGFSMGAMTVLAYASRHPERVRSAIVAGIDTEPEPRSRVAARLMDPDRIRRDEPAWAAALERRHAPVQGPGQWERLLRAIAAEVPRQAPLTPAELRRIRLPVLYVVGDRDVFVPLDHAVALRRALPDAQLLVIPGCGHVVTAEQPGIFNAAAEAFLRAHRDRSAAPADLSATP
ncbi:MAG: alpha/beta fold hydrolase [Chloroflexota bacterium]